MHKMLIGTGGKLIRSIRNDCGGVDIKFPERNSGSDKVTIRGPSEDMEKAAKLLNELADEKQLSGVTVEVSSAFLFASCSGCSSSNSIIPSGR